ncbi:MAG: group II truncated hemoglobin [Gammaproteobacteria bacterium]|nr:group II truncated hemoglobin [Gammaproteobacteria bacterium]
MAYGEDDASFQAAGGEDGLRHLVDDFYDIMDSLPLAAGIRAMHPADLAVSRDKLARFLCGWLGGPNRFNEKYGPITIPGAHRHLDIREAERDAWLVCMKLAIDRQDWAADFKDYLLRALVVPAERTRLVCERLQHPPGA